MIAQRFTDYLQWEDWQAGLFSPVCSRTEAAIADSVALLGSPDKFYDAASEMVAAWTTASSVNITNRGQNRQAWIGQATCCYVHKAPDWVTKRAWAALTASQQADANAVADCVADEWERRNDDAQALFG